MTDECVIDAEVDIDALARRVGELPPLPDALAEAVRALGQDSVPTARVIGLIERDQALAARMLRLANSSFYGVPGRVGSIADSVRLLGLRTVTSVLAAVSLRTAIGRPACEGFSFEDYWRHALAAALTARQLAVRVGLDPDEAFIAGLLHDVGRLVLVVHYPQAMARVFEAAREQGLAVRDVERRLLGIGHDEVGAMVTRHWHLPASLSEAIGSHERPAVPVEGVRCSLGCVVHVANTLAHVLDAGPVGDDSAPLLAADLWRALGLSAAEATAMLKATEAGLEALTAV